MSDRYILSDKTPVPEPDLMAWATWFETGERRVASDQIGDARVSTVFLGLNHNFGSGPPLLFETMIFGGKHAEHQERCGTWDEAEAQHARACLLARAELS